MKSTSHCYFYPVIILAIGLVASQIIFSVIVYQSNLSLHSHLSAIEKSGYLTVPNQHIINTLNELAPAFYGGLFFSLTTGAGITWITFILVWIWSAFSYRRRLLIPFFAFWTILIAMANINGINLAASSALIIIPVVVGYATIALFNGIDIRSFRKMFLAHFIVLILICLSWIPHLNSDTFISIRDYLLLGNSPGRIVNDFYYRYTMYPAEVFKSIDQKVLKICRLHIEDSQVYEAVEKKLRGLDYLKIDDELPLNVEVLYEKPRLIFAQDQKKIIESSCQDFLSNPDKIMSEFSDRCDINVFFRKITFLSLLFGFPITIYILIHSSMMMALFFISSSKLRYSVSTALCLAIGVSVTLPLYHAFSASPSQADIREHLLTKDWRIRTAALKKISDEGMGIDQFMDHLNYSDFKHIPEKYWFVRALSQSRNKNTINILHGYLIDPNPNVACMALYSLGKLNQHDSVDKIIELIKSSSHWYVQWYAYKALRRMGWTQSKRL
jgi:hypothetical protein